VLKELRLLLPLLIPIIIDLESKGINREQAQTLRASLATFADDWDSPEMSVYDNYDTANLAGSR
jgi:hypothetical protein